MLGIALTSNNRNKIYKVAKKPFLKFLLFDAEDLKILFEDTFCKIILKFIGQIKF